MYQDPVKNKNKAPMYTVEVFTKKGTDAQECKDHILETTGTVLGIYDKGTHYVTHMRVTLEILKKLNDFDYVLGVMGDYTGSSPSMGPRWRFPEKTPRG
jgi:flavorubredoxin